MLGVDNIFAVPDRKKRSHFIAFDGLLSCPTVTLVDIPKEADRKIPRYRKKKERDSQCLKITQNVAFNIASEASYIYKSSLKNQKTVNLASFWKSKASGQTVLPDRSLWIGQKLVENAKIQMKHFSNFDIFLQLLSY